MEQWNVGAKGPEFVFSTAQRILIAGRAIWFYFGKILWPANLAFIYPRWHIDPRATWQWLFPAGVVIVIGILWILRSRIGRGPLAAVLFFVGTLFRRWFCERLPDAVFVRRGSLPVSRRDRI